ncbi:hypothetical protein D9601_16650 [Sphingomonas sp. MA1305]|nr:hypothetical protein [Sphingomonas sp. MA1305]MCP4025516.1 hypothetical protein [Sphingomonas sp.]
MPSWAAAEHPWPSGRRVLLRRGRISLAYLWRHRRLPRLDAPSLFTELVQHRKLHDRDPRLGALVDKVIVKAWVAQQLGQKWVTPTLWTGSALPALPPWPRPFVVKSRHGCRQHAFVRTGDEDWAAIRRGARRWMRGTYGRWLDEWAYSGLTPGLLVEPFIGKNGVLPIDYKFFVFAGHVAYIQVHLGREHDHRWILLDRDWRRVSARTSDPDPAPPRALAAMIVAAEALGREFPFVRVDLYATGGHPRFGEMTFYPGSGLDPFAPVSLDARLGTDWLAALGGSSQLGSGSQAVVADIASSLTPCPST